MIAWVLIIVFGGGDSRASFSIPNIASKAECMRLAKEVGKRYGSSFAPAKPHCVSYRIAASTLGAYR